MRMEQSLQTFTIHRMERKQANGRIFILEGRYSRNLHMRMIDRLENIKSFMKVEKQRKKVSIRMVFLMGK